MDDLDKWRAEIFKDGEFYESAQLSVGGKVFLLKGVTVRTEFGPLPDNVVGEELTIEFESSARVASKDLVAAIPRENRKPGKVYFVTDAPPGPDGCEFIEVEDHLGASIGLGKWVLFRNGLYGLEIDDPRPRPEGEVCGTANPPDVDYECVKHGPDCNGSCGHTRRPRST